MEYHARGTMVVVLRPSSDGLGLNICQWMVQTLELFQRSGTMGMYYCSATMGLAGPHLVITLVVRDDIICGNLGGHSPKIPLRCDTLHPGH